MNNLTKNTLILFGFAILFVVLFGCSSSIDDAPDAQIPKIITISEDVSTMVDVPEEISVVVSVSDGGMLSYQWYTADSEVATGEMILGATGATFTPQTQIAGIFYYYCVITNKLGSSQQRVTSPRITYTVSEWVATEEQEPVPAVTFTAQPVAMSVVPYNQTITLSCTAESAAGYQVSYRWYESEDGTASTGTAVDGATASTLVLDPITEKGIYYYYCVATAVFPAGDSDDIESAAAISNVVSVAYTGLPVVQIDTIDGTPTPSKEKHYGRLQIFYSDGKKYDSGTNNDFSIKVRGNATAGYPKRPYKLKLPKKANLLDTDSSKNKDKNWVLLAGYCDKTLLRNKIGFFTASLFNGIEGNEQLYVPHSEFVDVVLNGEYIGNYCLTDSVKEGSERLAVNEKATEDGGIGFVAEYDSNYYTSEPKYFKSEKKQYPYTFKFPDTDDANFDSYMADFEENINNFESALYDSDSEDWQKYIDVESFARWFLAHNIIANGDTNYFFSKKTSDDSSKLVMGPVWDFEWSIGIGWYYGSRPRPADYWCVNDWYFAELLKKAEFVAEVKSQWEKLNSAYPDLAGTINAKMDEYAESIGTSQKINFMRWNILNTSVSVGGIPLGTYEAELNCDKQFMTNRIPWLDGAISGL